MFGRQPGQRKTDRKRSKGCGHKKRMQKSRSLPALFNRPTYLAWLKLQWKVGNTSAPLRKEGYACLALEGSASRDQTKSLYPTTPPACFCPSLQIPCHRCSNQRQLVPLGSPWRNSWWWSQIRIHIRITSWIITILVLPALWPPVMVHGWPSPRQDTGRRDTWVTHAWKWCIWAWYLSFLMS